MVAPARTGKGFPCSQCGGPTKVIWSRFDARVGTRRRRCRDPHCGHADTTYELRTPPPPPHADGPRMRA